MHQRREKATAWFARAPENLIIFVGTGGKLAVSPRRDFPSFDSPRLIESVCKQRHRLVQPRCVCVCVCIEKSRKKRTGLVSARNKANSFLLAPSSPPRRFPYPYLSFKESFDDRPLPLLSDQLDNLIYLRLSNELVADRYRLSVRRVARRWCT